MEARVDAEVRRLHIIYFLRLEGYDEHPHLVKVHHLSNTSLKLRDIKGWLGDVRGRNMPESFAWSFKRKYKTGYVWQDVSDDDDVSPISDNEYVLQGSQIPCNTNTPDPSQTSLSSDDPSTKLELESESNSLLSKLPVFGKIDEKGMTTARRAPPGKSRLPSSLRNLISCGGVDTKKSAVATARRKSNGPPFHPRDNVGPTGPSYDWTITEKSRGTRHQWSRFESRDLAKDSMKMTNSTYSTFVPLIWPKCAQCGKMFKPEKLHRHMKSCKGMNKSFNEANMNRAVYFPSSDKNKSQMGDRAKKSCNFSFS